jgi:hypothetical protein
MGALTMFIAFIATGYWLAKRKQAIKSTA